MKELLQYDNQACQAVMVDYVSLGGSGRHPGLSGLSDSLRDTTKLAMVAVRELIPSFCLIIVYEDRIETLLPPTPLVPATARAVATAIVRLDTALANLPTSRNDQTNTNSLETGLSRVLAILASQCAGKELQLHLVTCRSFSQIWKSFSDVFDMDRLPTGFRVPKILIPQSSFVSDNKTVEENLTNIDVQMFYDRLVLDEHCRKMLLHQTSDLSDLRLELSHRALREVLHLDLFSRTVKLDGGPEPFLDDNIVRSVGLVSEGGVCQSLLVGEVCIGLATQAKLFSWRELEENCVKVKTLHSELLLADNSLLLTSNRSHLMFVLVACPSGHFMLKQLATAEQLLPIPAKKEEKEEDEEGVGRRTVGILRELAHCEIYNPLEFNMGCLDNVRNNNIERSVSGEKGGRGRGMVVGSHSRGRGKGGKVSVKMPVV